jgi:hypothetical protein
MDKVLFALPIVEYSGITTRIIPVPEVPEYKSRASHGDERRPLGSLVFSNNGLLPCLLEMMVLVRHLKWLET